MKKRVYLEWVIFVVGIGAAIASGVWAWHAGGPYGERFTFDPRVRRTYDAEGRLSELAFDADGDLVFDTWSYFEGDRLVRMEFDDDRNGTRDRRQHFKADGTVERTESLSREPEAPPGAQ